MSNSDVGILFFILALVIALTIVYSVACYSAHIHMILREDKPYDFVGFKTFIFEFNRYKKDHKISYDKEVNGIFGEDRDDLYLCASIIRFNNKCMILYPISFFKYCLWTRKVLKESKDGMAKRNRIKGLFNN